MPGYRVERWNALHPPNSAMLRYTLSSEGFEVFQWSDRPGTVYGPHKHGEDQSHWIVSGQLEISVRGGGTFQLGTGDRDFMPADTYHSARVIGEEPVLYLVGVKQPPPPSVKKPKRKPSAKRKSTAKGPTQQSKTAAKKPKSKPATKKQPATSKPKSGKPEKRSKKKT